MIDGNMHPNYGAAGVLEEDCIELDRYGVELPDELFEL
jgi:hypothetical protein